MVRIRLRGAVLSLAFLAAAVMLILLAATAVIQDVSAGTPAVQADNQETGRYVIGAYNGRVAVFFGGDRKAPVIETTIDISSLRAVDRQKLDQGIDAATYEDVLRLLEDFSS
ncbi:BofC C-terminal domain-containing protein [Oscillospiraceae bacterium CM]|nr:BofC C-terminal domain-containing protein [Oscillospiraceae bacterium CM]